MDEERSDCVLPVDVFQAIAVALKEDPTLVSLALSSRAIQLAVSQIGFPSDDWSEDFCKLCIQFGYLDLLVWGVKNGCELSEEASSLAAQEGQLSIIQWLLSTEYNVVPFDISSAAARGGNTEILQFLKEQGLWVPSSLHANAAASSGNIDALTWVTENGCGVDGSTAYPAVLEGNMDVLEWCYHHCGKVNSSIWNAAASCGSTKILSWLCQFDNEEGNEWWIRDLCEFAAKKNNWDVLSWLLESGYKINARGIEAIAKSGNICFLEIALAHVEPARVNIFSLQNAVVSSGDIDMIRWFVKTYGAIRWTEGIFISFSVYVRHLFFLFVHLHSFSLFFFSFLSLLADTFSYVLSSFVSTAVGYHVGIASVNSIA
eukprot:TRINITY_DN4077_c0_g1_i1.p1 TRINITY_DN4077_c0_g1~~TRINITY_DN4077_c0_g1_i1.p1  ORF type:complete len:373 (-),score=48.04 TRINITY_DN4077_c0_g1_i1:779-1897(-)